VMNAKEAGFDNLSIDLIYGIRPAVEREAAAKSWIKNIEFALRLDVDHLSCYALTVETRTVLGDMIKKKKLQAPDEEEAVAEFEMLTDLLGKAGYEHYEISNFARNKKYSRHNTSYWQRKKYIGIGPSAHSFNGVSRQWNVSNNQLYIKSIEKGEIPSEAETLTIENKFNEYILTSLRTMWGVDINFIEEEFGKPLKNLLEKGLKHYLQKEMIQQSGNKIILTPKGKLFADRIASDLFIES
jgi:oxygen-independent coproporphyrinogen III oxidase